ncbi:BTB (POZ) domain-containing protein 8 [Rhizophlyctis rosea]|uniref:BTB (POZ) domain-containing protein 8 n=1 Tax=Rhizophlyctis rosea TaxID=64517 RepID=A0AAD5X3F3_9FUNG|nr:BTB (POZ) domain-containing protein 8 [Rhizophlyctis rosea]
MTIYDNNDYLIDYGNDGEVLIDSGDDEEVQTPPSNSSTNKLVKSEPTDTLSDVFVVEGPLYFNNLSADTSLHARVNERLLSLLKTGADADVCLKVGSEEVEMKAHSLILKSASDFFATALSGDWAESKNNEIKLHSIEPTVMQIILEYIYGGVLKMSNELHKTLDLYDALKYLYLPEACTAIRTSLTTTLRATDDYHLKDLPRYWSEIEKRNHADLHETVIEVFGHLLKEACDGTVNEEMVKAIAKMVETVEDVVKVLKGAWSGVGEGVERPSPDERRRVRRARSRSRSPRSRLYRPDPRDRSSGRSSRYGYDWRYDDRRESPSPPPRRDDNANWDTYTPGQQHKKHATYCALMFVNAWMDEHGGAVGDGGLEMLLRGVSEICGFVPKVKEEEE